MGWAYLGGCIIASLAFLGMVWLVERARWAFWKAAIQKSCRCNYSGCLCPCHGAIDDNLSGKELDLLEGQFNQMQPPDSREISAQNVAGK